MLDQGTIRGWKHITKLDPDKSISDHGLAKVMDSGTDAVLVGGTLDVDRSKMTALVDKVLEYDIPVLMEPSSPENIVDRDGVSYFVPTVMNSATPDMIVGMHCKWAMSGFRDWDKVFPEAYIVLNPKSSVAKYTGANCDLTREQVVSYANVAQNYFRLPIVYLEYSGTFGDPSIVGDVSKSMNGKTALFYGGGIRDREKAMQMAEFATIIVGNVLYEDLEGFLQTVP
ncbi:MAG: heptaprenylglyceryl phosphate synthase [Candidatus Aenigmarchaeota archaeon]|nr:heptaprenylglyceryl phosphate synthase [Candidatus Aenigmarchaeota archaeon]